eukprot:TRINITY_DN820_c0_g1_i3.p1 TRINITY_DN820_c0_g1~~TRINITY_DN820_c0_g1_i3.p1  ORF type:complete len:593 (-),score=119.95 TRINITY_DN820_c0_g1_i3:53-1684(-)
MDDAELEREVQKRVLLELASTFTHTDGSRRIEAMEKSMSSMFQALPKDATGGLKHDVVRYALHRFFMQRRAWYIRGLDPQSEKAVRASDTIDGVKFDFTNLHNEHPTLPTILQSSLERQHADIGLGLKEVAAVAASLEDLAHKEALSRLDLAYDALQIDKGNAQLSFEDVDRIVDTYVTMYSEGIDFKDWSVAAIRKEETKFKKSKRWSEIKPSTKALERRLYNELFAGGKRTHDYNDTARLIEALGDNFGEVNDGDCRDLKRALLSMEWKKPGRVRLSDFYNNSHTGDWWFGEKVNYLRKLGVLDETNASNPLVIISNYVYSPTQCNKPSSLYDMCCRNQCDDLMLQLETSVMRPDASPEKVAQLVAGMSTETVKARDQLSDALQERLRWIAGEHQGRVPIHSRKFALWMHHAFPRECPFPHKEGTTSPLTPDEWMRSQGESSHMADDAQMNMHIRPDDTCTSGDCAEQAKELPWIEYSESMLNGDFAEQYASGGEWDDGIESSMLWTNVLFLLVVAVLAMVARFQGGYATKWELAMKSKIF